MIVGEDVTVMNSTDHSLVGLRGEVALETANTILLVTGGRRVTVAKAGSVLMLNETGLVLDGNEIRGSLDDRLKVRKR